MENEASEIPEGEICIDVEGLSHLSAKDLVCDEHSSAPDLCGSKSSCATPGHIVNWDWQPMLMKNYYHLSGGCEEQLMKVDIPRCKQKIGMHIKNSRLEYTASSA